LRPKAVVLLAWTLSQPYTL